MYGLLRSLKLAWIALIESIAHPDETSIVTFDKAGRANIERTGYRVARVEVESTDPEPWRREGG